MRRIVAILLIAASGWLLYQTAEHFTGVEWGALSKKLVGQIGNPQFILPAIGGALGLLGGLIALFGGVGGAAIAMIGGVLAAGFSLYIGNSFWTGALDVWNNQAVVGLAILILAGFTALMGRS